MKTLLLVLFLVAGISNVHAGFEGRQDNTSIGIFDKIDCSTGVACSKIKDRLTITVLESSISAQDEGLNLGRLAIFVFAK
jgi:hypothetical protein